MEFVSLRSIIYDLMNIIRAAKISDNELISERLIESWIHSYRAKLIKQDIDKDKYINPDYVQELSLLELIKEEQEIRNVYRTTTTIPKSLDFNYKSGLLFVGDVEDNAIMLVPQQRVVWQQFRRFTRSAPLAYLKNRYIYIHNPRGLQYIKVRGIFEVPTEADVNMTLDSKYPIPINMLDTLKQMILKQELNIISNSFSDSTNDDTNILETNVSTKSK